MFRILTLVAALAVATFLTSATGADEPGKNIKIGVPFKDELKAESKAKLGGFVNTVAGCYGTDKSVVLKEGQSVHLEVTVTGKGRRVLVGLSDPTGKFLGGTPTWGTGRATFTHDEVPSTGTYSITIISDLIGPFVLETSATPDDELQERALVEKLARLKKEVEQTEARLKAISEKKKK